MDLIDNHRFIKFRNNRLRGGEWKLSVCNLGWERERKRERKISTMRGRYRKKERKKGKKHEDNKKNILI